MAIGAALLFNIVLPINFNSPYKALNIQDFWRRWHITLSRFLKSYVYISLGGNRIGKFRTYANLMATFLIGGLWHGAGWTFVFWGGLHGTAIVIHRIWSYFGVKLWVGLADYF
jgi:alginate O-acetyltransferase complex protein AlgI